MKRVNFILVFLYACFVLFLGASVQSDTHKTNKIKKESQFLLVTGILLKKDRTPIPNQAIYFIPLAVNGSQRSTAVSWEDGKLANPSAITDSKGRFTIKVPRAFIEQEEEFTVGLNPASIYGPTLPKINDALVSFKVDSETCKLDIGKIIVEK